MFNIITQGFEKVSVQLFTQFLIDFIAVFILIGVIYYRSYRRTDLFLTFFGFNVIIFFMTFMLNKTEMSMGAAFGLFAVFSILRFRTEGLAAKDMTYLFLVIALGLIIAINRDDLLNLCITVVILLGIVGVLETSVLIKKEHTHTITYDKIGLILPEKRAELLQDLRNRMGINIHRVEIREYDFLKDATQLTVFYYN